MSVEVGLGLGSNIGDKPARIHEAVARLRDSRAVANLELSNLYRTEPWGFEAQDWFVNACAVGTTELTPHALLEACLKIEAEMRRERTMRWGPRVIDIDVLYYDALTVKDERLTLPHPEIGNRAFVLVPLAELRPALAVNGISATAALAKIGSAGVVPLESR